jgi:hypothetical protein
MMSLTMVAMIAITVMVRIMTVMDLRATMILEMEMRMEKRTLTLLQQVISVAQQILKTLLKICKVKTPK